MGLGETGDDKSISYSRHPLTFLVEAADDICYTIIDFEDGINLGLIQEEFALEYLINLVRDSINTKKYNALTNTEDRISYLRALAINSLINETVNIFVKNEEAILKGKYASSLLDKCKYEAQINDIIKISIEKIYQSKEVIDKEISGYAALHQLLKTYTTAIQNSYQNEASNYDKLILKTLPSSVYTANKSLFDRLLSVCGHVALFSDSNAVTTYKKLKGFLLK